jgi:hypothetical protein
MMIRTYRELSRLQTFDERFQYLCLNGNVGESTFGFDRFINQRFYKSKEWKIVRDFVIVRDNGCDLGLEGYEIYERILIHHMNPISAKDIESRSDFLLDPEFLITTTHLTHNAITYSDKNLLAKIPMERSRNDTCPWRHV